MEAHELEIQRISQSLNLKAVKKARTRRATSARGNKSRSVGIPAIPNPFGGAPPSGIEVVSQTVAPPTPSQDGASQTTKTQLGVIPQEPPDQSQAQSDTR